jgi:glyoxylase-like metal-dependent hydrolase (beta-lactamase superfamily II)/rhodanese-related sulfurtransferase
MFIQQLYTNCLAQAAYYIESEGEAAIIDPLRDYEIYTQLAASRNATIKYIFETHFHADFVSGHIDLGKKTGATIVFGPTAQPTYQSHIAKDGEEFFIGKIKIKLLHTPGHTPESSCYLLIDESGKEHSVFTGDTLFVGDVGRPDLLDGLVSKEELAGMMYDSLHTKIMVLADEVIVYPAHGAGSACGKNIGKETFSTIGEQKHRNYALQQMSKEQFIAKVTDGIQPAPAYFFKDVAFNKQGYLPIDELMKKGMKALSVNEFEDAIKTDATIIDTRIPDIFENGFIPKALNFGLNGQYAIWAATILDISKPVIIVAEIGKEKESIERLARVGFDHILGFLDGGFEAWRNANKRFDMVISIDDEEFELDAKHTETTILDVRKIGEYNDEHLSKAVNFPLDHLKNDFKKLDPEKEYLIHCAGGYRSMIASSFLKAQGFHRVKNVWGGYEKIKTLKLPITKAKSLVELN